MYNKIPPTTNRGVLCMYFQPLLVLFFHFWGAVMWIWCLLSSVPEWTVRAVVAWEYRLEQFMLSCEKWMGECWGRLMARKQYKWLCMHRTTVPCTLLFLNLYAFIYLVERVMVGIIQSLISKSTWGVWGINVHSNQTKCACSVRLIFQDKINACWQQ